MTRGMILPLAAILALAGAIGLYLGVAAAPVSEGDIIERWAAEYVASTGGDRSDCYGVPAGVEGVRLMVICEAGGSDPWFVAVDAQGARVDSDLVFGEDGT